MIKRKPEKRFNKKSRFCFFLSCLPKHPFWFGFGSILNLSGKNDSNYQQKSDLNELKEDWEMVGFDILDSLYKNTLRYGE